eukprot:1790022-Prymnesium_polylepis.2
MSYNSKQIPPPPTRVRSRGIPRQLQGALVASGSRGKATRGTRQPRVSWVASCLLRKIKEYVVAEAELEEAVGEDQVEEAALLHVLTPDALNAVLLVQWLQIHHQRDSRGLHTRIGVNIATKRISYGAFFVTLTFICGRPLHLAYVGTQGGDEHEDLDQRGGDVADIVAVHAEGFVDCCGAEIQRDAYCRQTELQIGSTGKPRGRDHEHRFLDDLRHLPPVLVGHEARVQEPEERLVSLVVDSFLRNSHQEDVREERGHPEQVRDEPKDAIRHQPEMLRTPARNRGHGSQILAPILVACTTHQLEALERPRDVVHVEKVERRRTVGIDDRRARPTASRPPCEVMHDGGRRWQILSCEQL